MGKFIFFGIRVLKLPKSEDDMHGTFALPPPQKKKQNMPLLSLGNYFDFQVRRMLSVDI